MTEKNSVTAPKADTPTSATPPDTVATPLVMSVACSRKVSSEPLPPLMKSPKSLRLTWSRISGRSRLNPRTASPIACASTRTTTAMAITMPNTSSVAHRALLQRRRRSIAVATGERTATLKTDTRMISSALPIDASAPATATMPAATSSVRTEMDTTTSGRPVSVTAVPASPS